MTSMMCLTASSVIFKWVSIKVHQLVLVVIRIDALLKAFYEALLCHLIEHAPFFWFLIIDH